MQVLIIGSGYVGLVAAVTLAHIGHTVYCVDVDKTKIRTLQQYKCTIFEKDLQEYLESARERLTFGTSLSSACSDEPDVVIIAVGTPEKTDGSANLSYLYTAADQLISNLRKSCVVVIKSTVPIGTNQKLQQYFRKNLPQDIEVEVVSNPEFLSQGTALHDMLYGGRIVVGTSSEQAQSVMDKLYEKFNQPILYTDVQSAEMIKYASNDFLALKISYINEIANLCETLGANVDDVAKGMGMDIRIGSHFLKAGIGYGGSCFPKDTKALHWLGRYHDMELKTVKAAIEVNENQKITLLKKSRKYFDSLDGLVVAVLGLAFKPDTDDIREAPSLSNIPIMLDDGAKVKAWDPIATEHFKKLYPQVTYCDEIRETLIDADVCFIFTEWKKVRELPPDAFLAMKTPIILDGRNCYPVEQMEGYPLVYDSIGRNTISGVKEDSKSQFLTGRGTNR